MMQTIDQHYLEEKFTGVPMPETGNMNIIEIYPACHPGAPVYPMYAQGSGQIGLRCCACGQVSLAVLVAKSLIAHVGPAETRKINGGG